MKKTLSLILGSAILSGGAVFGATLGESAQVTDLKSEKHSVLKDNIWKDVRLGEVPEWDISIVSAEEMTSAYAELATELNAKETENLYTNLSVKAEELDVKCLTK